MGSFKKLSKADVTTVDYSANKRWSINYTSFPNDQYAVYYIGKNEPFLGGSTTTNSQYKSLIYSEINHLFYQAYTSSLNTGSIMFNTETYESASSQRPTASYFNYNINPLLTKQFPSASGNEIGVLSINQNIFGSKILPHSFNISSSNAFIADDGNGNLYNIKGYEDDYIALGYISSSYFNDTTPGIDKTLVGNIFYAHGIVTITNQNSFYLQFFSNCYNASITASVAPGETVTFYYTNCNNLSRTSTYSNSTLATKIYYDNICLYSVSNVVSSSTNSSGIYDLSSFCPPINSPVKISFQNEHTIYENEIRCIVRESDFNLSYNPTILKYGGQYITSGSSGYTLTGSFDSTVKDFATGSAFQPYVTTIGLYNDDNELLMVAKLGKPIMLSPDTDTTFIVRYDT